MDPGVIIFLSSGLFLGWALGANDAANVFGTAVGTHMVRWITAAVICSIFVVIGAVVSGAGTSGTLARLGEITALPGAFMTALAAAIAVYTMNKSGLTVSTSQTIVGGIVGWNLFSGNPTNTTVLSSIVGTWVVCPLLAGVIAVVLYKLLTLYLRYSGLHMVRVDAYLRVGLILAGAFGAYALGANNIANVVGVFLPSDPFPAVEVSGVTISSQQQLLLIGGLAVAAGVLTFSRGVMLSVGGEIGRLSPSAAFVAVLSHSLVLFAFASRGLESWLEGMGLPTLPLVPVSSSQAIVGAIVGIAILQGVAGIRWRVLGNFIVGWLTAPVLAGLICFFGLYFLQNVFDQTVY